VDAAVTCLDVVRRAEEDPMHPSLTPVDVTGPRPDPADVDGSRYLRAYLLLRVLIGAGGICLPFVLVLVDRGLLGENPFVRGSLSAYYYSGVRDIFVGSLFAVGVFLITYKVVEHNLDNTLSTLAGVAALAVALFPTGRPQGGIALTPLQRLLGEQPTMYVHFTSAAVFILALAVICYCFGLREGRRSQHRGVTRTARTPQFWRRLHWTCSAVILLSLAYLLAAKFFGGPTNALLHCEVLSVWAFGTSWLFKGAELDILLGRRQPSPVEEQLAI
jgi:hypothetical protein